MSTHAHAAHGGHEASDFEGHYAILAIPFSMLMLVAFMVIVSLWVPAAASHEMRIKEQAGAEAARQSLLEHRNEEARALEAGEGRIAVTDAMGTLAAKAAGN